MASSSADRISSLPNDVREHILMFLPLRDAAKSSLLSPNWRNLWTNLPSLVFDQSFVHKRSVPRMIKDESLAFDAICNVLIHHRGPLRELTISVSISKGKIEQIMKLLHPQAIESLTIASDEVCYKLQMQMLSSFSQLRTLRLSCCELASSPVSLQCFKHLTVLELRFAEFPQNPAEWRFSRLKLLTTLTLDRCYRPRQLPDIVIEEAPRLSCFHFVGKFNSLQLNSAPLLKTVFIRKTNLAWTVESNLLKVNGGLAAVESLSVTGFFYEYLATEEAQDVESNQKPFEKLRHMRLDNVCLSRTKHACSFLRLINSSPNLQQLTITLNRNYGDCYSDVKNSDDFEALKTMKSSEVDASNYEWLKRVEVKRFEGTEDELTVISWILNSSPALEQMEIQFSNELSDAEKMVAAAELNGFRKASTRARIIII